VGYVLTKYGTARSVGEDSSSGTRLTLILQIPPSSIHIPFQIPIKKCDIINEKKRTIEANVACDEETIGYGNASGFLLMFYII
jgi:hypothetical protein